MVNSVTEKSIIKPNSMYMYPTYCSQTPAKPVSQDINTTVETKKASNRKNLLYPLGLIVGGGIMMYYGLRRPSADVVYGNYVKSKQFEMDKKIRTFTSFVRDSLSSIYEDVNKYVADFKQKRFLNPESNLRPFRVLDNPKQVVDAQEIAFEAVRNSVANKSNFGASDFDEFAAMLSRLRGKASGTIERQKNIVKRELGDYVHVTGIRNEKFSDLVESSENQLIEMKNFLCTQADNISREQLFASTKRQYVKIADLIIESRRRVRQTKENIIDAAFERVSKLLKLKDFYPNYDKIPSAVDFSRLTPNQLKPTKLPKCIKENSNMNIFLRIIETKDFSKLTDRDLYEFFYSTSYENNLKDLGYLIDRLRLRQVVEKHQNPKKGTSLDVIIPKLEYLSKQLNDFGKRELLNVLDKDFDKMGLEKKRASIYYISRVARRLGYENIQQMDAHLLKENAAYKDMDIRKYINIFVNNPDIYFF